MPAYRQPEARVNNTSTGIAENGDEAPPAPPRSGQRVGVCWVPGRTGTPCEKGKAQIGGEMTTTEAWRKLKPGPAKVLHVLWEAAGGATQTDTGEVFLACRISLAKLSERSGYSTRSVSRHIGTLKRAGFVDVVSTGRTNGYNLIPFPAGFVSDLASQDGQDRRASVDDLGAPDTPKLARLHIPSSKSPPVNPPPTTTPSAPAKRKPTAATPPLTPGSVVVVELLIQRGLTRQKAESLATTASIPDVVRACAELDAGILNGPGGVVTALTNGWGYQATLKLTPRTLDDTADKALSKNATEWWRRKPTERASVLGKLREHFDHHRNTTDDEDAPLTVKRDAYALRTAMRWWFDDNQDERTKAVWCDVVRVVHPEWSNAPRDYPPTILAAFMLSKNVVKLSCSKTDAAAAALRQRRLAESQRREERERGAAQ